MKGALVDPFILIYSIVELIKSYLMNFLCFLSRPFISQVQVTSESYCIFTLFPGLACSSGIPS